MKLLISSATYWILTLVSVICLCMHSHIGAHPLEEYTVSMAKDCRAAAEVAEKKGGAAGPASLRLHLIDTLHTLSKDELSKQNVQLSIEEHKS